MAFHARDFVRRQMRATVRHGNVDCRNLVAFVKPDRHTAKHSPDRAGDHVIRRVLLHMIKAPRPIDCAMHLRADFERLIRKVHHVAVHDLDVQHARGIDEPRVERLTAGGRVKRAAIKANVEFAACGNAGGNARVEFRQISIVIVKS